MNNSEESLVSAITSTRSYGATHSRMLTEINTNLIKHKLLPTDTLQGLAIRYGATVEKLKRLNKLWSNESILAKEYLLIPTEHQTKPVDNKQNAAELYVKPDTPIKEVRERKLKKKQIALELGSDGELGSSTGEDSAECVKDFNDIISKADHHINVYKQQRGEGSEAFQAFNSILSNIDKTIEIHKSRTKNMEQVPNLPVVAYDGNYQSSSSALFSPTSQHPYLEHGI